MISFIIPTLNEETTIEKTLKNIKEFSLDKEIIVSDGGSKDRTTEIAKRFTDKVLVHSKKERQNIAGGRNSGAKEAKGEFVVFVDADVLIPNINSLFDIGQAHKYASYNSSLLNIANIIFSSQITSG